MTDFNPLWITAAVAVLGAAAGVFGLAWKIARWTNKVDEAKDGWKSAVRDFKKELRRVRKRVDALFEAFGRQTIGAESPVRLTEFGQELSKKLKATAWAVRTADSVRGEVEGKEAWEIQDFCFTYSKEKLSDERERDVKRVAYEAGIEDVKVRNVLAVELRDQLLNLLGLDAPE